MQPSLTLSLGSSRLSLPVLGLYACHTQLLLAIYLYVFFGEMSFDIWVSYLGFVCKCSYVCWSTCEHVPVDAGVRLKCHFSVNIQSVLKTGSFHWPVCVSLCLCMRVCTCVTNSAELASQSQGPVCLSLSPQHWDHKCRPPWHFTRVLGIKFGSSRLSCERFTDRAISLAPVMIFFLSKLSHIIFCSEKGGRISHLLPQMMSVSRQ